MQVSMVKFGALSRRLSVTLPADDLEKAYSARLKRMSRQARVPGFRPGKVPQKIVEQQYGAQLLEEAAGELIQTSFRAAVGQEGLRPAGGPQISPQALKRGEEFKYTAEFEVYPEIPPVTLAGVRIERPRAAIGDDDINRTLETIRRQRTRYDVAARPAQTGDRVKIDFVGRLNGETFEGGSAQGFQLVIGSQTLLEDLEKGLLGAQAGDARSIAVRFPANYPHEKLAGQTVEFDTKIIEVAGPVMPELNDALARELGVASGSIEELRTQVRDNLAREASRRGEAAVRARVMKALLAKAGFEVPQALIDDDLRRSRAAATDAAAREQARKRVTLGLMLGEAMRERGLAADAASVRAKLEGMAQEYDSPQEFVQWHYAEPGRLAQVEAMVMEEQIIDELLKTAEVVDQEMGFQDLLKLNETL